MDITLDLRPGSTFSRNDTRPAGHIFFIPGDERPGDDPKNRPHFLVNRCNPAVDRYALGTLAHMSTKPTEIIQFGCAGHEIRSGGNFVIAGRLLPRLASDLDHSRYSAVDEVQSVRRSVRRAVGIGEGNVHKHVGSVRGRLARIVDQQFDFSFGLVLTAHEYSAERRYQMVVPIIDRLPDGEGGLEEIELTRWDVIPTKQTWSNGLPLHEPLIETAGLLSLTEEWKQSRNPGTWLHGQIEVTAEMVDATTLVEVEAKISERLLL